MKRFLCSAVSLILCFGAYSQNFSAYDLKCEAQREPLAIHTLTPRLSWKIAAQERNMHQKAYEVSVSSSLQKARVLMGDMWRSGKVYSDNSMNIVYGGLPLEAGHEYWWSVRIFDEKGSVSQWSAPERFAIGLLEKKDWNEAGWIGMEVMPQEERIVPGIEYKDIEKLGDRHPGINKIPILRKEFTASKSIRRAMVYISGLGFFDMYLNGKKVSDHVLDPAATDYDKLVNYVAFDVTKDVRVGRNAIGVMLGNGYVSIPMERYYKGVMSYMYPKLMMCMNIEYNDGTTQNVISDTSWKCSESPITYTSIYGGEDYDATKLKSGWTGPEFLDTDWQDVVPAPLPDNIQVKSSSSLPMRIMEKFPYVSKRRTRHGKWVYDLGQNFQGTVELTVKGKCGQTVRMNTAELFDTVVDSISITGGYRGEYRLSYTINEDNKAETWHPQFTYWGLRYVLVSGAVPEGVDNPDALPEIVDIRGLHLRNSAPRSGSFECSDQLLNKTARLIEWAIKGNMASFLTDCPHREKLPWLEQTHLMFGSLYCAYDMLQTYYKCMEDISLAQWDNGLVPDIAPMYMLFKNGFLDSPEWGSTSILMPWKVYEYYGDASLLTKYYATMQKYMDYLHSKADNHILSHGLGDWYDIGPRKPGISQHTSLEATATPVYYMDAVVMKNVATMLGKKEDAERYSALADAIRTSYNERFFHSDTFNYDRGSQCANAIAVCSGICLPENARKVVDNIVKDIRARGNQLTAGDVGYNYVLRALESFDEDQVIYDINSRYDKFGYGYQIAQDATALPETWDALPNKSHNHLMLGHLYEWFYTGLCGLERDKSDVAFRKSIVRPAIVGDIKWAKGSIETPFGTLSCQWNKEENRFRMVVEIPANTRSTVYVPASQNDEVLESGISADRSKNIRFIGYKGGYKCYSVGSGTYIFEVK